MSSFIHKYCMVYLVGVVHLKLGKDHSNSSEQCIKNYQQNFLERQNNEQHIVLQI